MKKRIGNDISLSFTIKRDGSAESFTGKALDLQLFMADGTLIPFEWTTSGNTLNGVVYGKDQHKTGKVFYLFIENDGNAGMASVDGVAFTLVDHTYKEADLDDDPVAYDLDIDGSTTGVSVNVATAVGKDGASAYEIAVKHGYQGTEEEWVQSLTPKPVFSVGNDGYLYVTTN